MYALYALLAVVALILLLLVLPFSAKLRIQNGKISVKLYYSGIKVYDTDKPSKQKKKGRVAKDPRADSAGKKEDFMAKLKRERGFKGTLEYFVAIIKIVLTVFKAILKHIKITQVVFCLSVASPDAAETAIAYGTACSTVYPCISLIESSTKFKAKKIDISSDFSSEESRLYLSLKMKANLLTAIVFELLKPKNFKKIKKECEKL